MRIVVAILIFCLTFSPFQRLQANDTIGRSLSGTAAQDIIDLAVEKTSPTEYVADELLVKFKDEKIDPESFLGKVKMDWLSFNADIEKEHSFAEGNLHLFKIEDGSSIKEKIEELKNNAAVEYVEPNYKMHRLDLGTNDTHKNYLWNLDNTGQTMSYSSNDYTGTADADIDMPEGWAVSLGATNPVVVAVIDEGVEYSHPDLTNNMWNGAACKDDTGAALGGCIHGYDYESGDLDPTPDLVDNDHGTHVAGIIGAQRNNAEGVAGIAPNVDIMAIKFNLTIAQEIIAIDFAIQNGAKIINESFGHVSGTPSPSEDAAISRFRAAGGLLVAAAGNDGADNDGATGYYPCRTTLDNIICVASTDMDDQILASSNFGTTSVDVGAPGGLILSTVNGPDYVGKSGTSMASPHVAGLAALMMGYKTLSYSQARSIILSTGDALGSLSGKVATGKRINAYGAMNYLATSFVATTISTFNFASPATTGTVNNTNHTVALTVPFGTDVTSLTPTITVASGATISPTSGTAQDFTNPVTYTVTAEDGTTTQAYTVTVTVAPSGLSSATTISTFNFASPATTGTVNNTNHTVALTVPFGTNVTSLTPTITLAAGATISPTSGTAQNFTNPVTYTVTAEDGVTTQAYTVTVTVAPSGLSTATTISTFNFASPATTGTVNNTNHTVALTVPYGTNVTSLTPTITLAAGATISPTSGTARNFTNPVTYTVTAEDGITTQVYTVTVTVTAPSTATTISTFNFASPATVGTINNTNHTVALTVPFGTTVTSLTPTIAVASGATISPTSGTAQDFTNPVTYTVTAQDGITTQAYTVTVTVAPSGLSTATSVLSFDFASPSTTGTVNNTNHTVALTVPFGTTVTSLTPTIIVSAGATISPTSGTAQDFTNPVTYTVTAEDGVTTQAYTVTVTVEPSGLSTDATISTFNFASPATTGTVNNTNHTVALTVPFGTNVTSLTPTIALAAGATISPTSGTARNFTSPVTYTVTAEDGITTQVYTVTVTVASLSTATTISTFNFSSPATTGTVNNTDHTVALTVPYGTNVTSLTPTITLATGATISPTSGTAQDFTNSVTYTVTAEDGTTTQAYVVTVTVAGIIETIIENVTQIFTPEPEVEHPFRELTLEFDKRDVKDKKTSKKEVTLEFDDMTGVKYYKISKHDDFPGEDWKRMRKFINLDIDQQDRESQSFFLKFKSDNGDTSRTYEKKVTFDPAPYSIFNFPKRAKKGDVMKQSGEKFSPNSDVAVYFSNFWGTYYKPVYVRTDDQGTFSIDYTVNKVFGWYHWYAVDLKTRTKSDSVSYLVY